MSFFAFIFSKYIADTGTSYHLIIIPRLVKSAPFMVNAGLDFIFSGLVLSSDMAKEKAKLQQGFSRTSCLAFLRYKLYISYEQ